MFPFVFLSWRGLRWLALDSALFSRPFNQDDLAAFEYLQDENKRVDLFNWLIWQPFVLQSPLGHYHYHDLAQELFSRHLYQISPRKYYSTRRSIADYYQSQLESVQKEGGNEVYETNEWLALVLALAYQFFLLPEESNHIKAIEHILHTYISSKQTEEIIRFLRKISQKQPDNQISANTQRTAIQLLEYIEADQADQQQKLIPAASDLLRILMHQSSFSSDLLADIYLKRSIAFLSLDEYELAIKDFDRTIELDPKGTQAYGLRGEAYRQQRQYEQALADFDQAITLDPKLAWAITSRGITYRLMERYEEAIADFDRAIALDEKYAWAIASRGLTYRLMERYQEALADFDRAIALDEKDAWTWVNRGRIYRMMRQYEKSLDDFNHGIDLEDGSDAWAFASRGQTYRKMKSYEEALADFNRAIALDKDMEWAVAMRGETYRLIGRYEEALADFNRTIALDEKDYWSRYQQGLIYLVIGRDEDFREALRAAIELAHANLSNEPDKLSASFNLALFNLVSGNPLAETEYMELISACSSTPHLHDAIDDLDDFLTIHPSNELAQRLHSQLQMSLKRVQGLSTVHTSSSSEKSNSTEALDLL